MLQEDFNKWTEIAFNIPKKKLIRVTMPLDIFFLEAEGVTCLFKEYWDPDPDNNMPGLSFVEIKLGPETGDEIKSLVSFARDLHTKIVYQSSSVSQRKLYVERGRFLVRELSFACKYILDDDVTEAADYALPAAKARLSKNNTIATLIQALVDHYIIADKIKDRLEKLGGFDIGYIKEAEELSSKLSELGPPAIGRKTSDEVEHRNRFCSLIAVRVKEIRQAAKYVFRNHPEVIRKFTSKYHRERRLKAKKKKGDK